MAKVTSKLQVTIPKRIADEFGIAPGDEIEFVAAADGLRVIPARASVVGLTRAERLALFDAASRRQRGRKRPAASARAGRGWKREELYERGRPR